MNRILGMIAAFAMALGFAIGIPHAPAFAADCSYHTSTDQYTFWGSQTDKDRWVQVAINVHYRHCIGDGGGHWVDPVSYRAAYNMEGTKYNCAWYTWFEGVRYNGYFWDGRGVNYNPGPVNAPCAEDTHWENTYSLAYAPNFRYCFGVPKWKFNVDLKVGEDSDFHTVLRGTMWGFTGPVPNC